MEGEAVVNVLLLKQNNEQRKEHIKWRHYRLAEYIAVEKTRSRCQTFSRNEKMSRTFVVLMAHACVQIREKDFGTIN